MVDISAKDTTDRVAMAECFVRMASETLALVESGTAKGRCAGGGTACGDYGGQENRRFDPASHPLSLSKWP